MQISTGFFTRVPQLALALALALALSCKLYSINKINGKLLKKEAHILVL